MSKLLKLFHKTTSKKADEILPALNYPAEFRDDDGVLFVEKPEVKGDALLSAHFREQEILVYEQPGKEPREWIIPVSSINAASVSRVPNCSAQIISKGVHKGVYFGSAPDAYEPVEYCDLFGLHSEYLSNDVGELPYFACDRHQNALRRAAKSKNG